MYVIRIRRGQDSWKYFCCIENQLLVISSISSKAMVFHNKNDALIMAGFIGNYFITLDPRIVIKPLSEEEFIDFSCDINEQYFEL